MTVKRMHCEEQLRDELEKIPHDQLCERWFSDGGYSTSMHLYLLYSFVIGMKAKRVAEVGCGRSTIVLQEACKKVGASFCSCDHNDYRWLYPELFVGNTDDFWMQFEDKFQVIFLDHLSSRDYTKREASMEIDLAWEHLDRPGIMAIHDVGCSKYAVSQCGWAKAGIILPYGNSLHILIKGKYNKEFEPWPKKKDSVETHNESSE